MTVVLVAWALATPAVPAAADHAPPAESHDPAGSGNFEGTELVEQQDGFPCFRVTRHLFGLRGVGTYEGRSASGGRVVFRGEIADGQTVWGHGPLRLEIENTEVYYHGPFGTHGTETGGGAGCSPSTTGTPVPAEFRVFAAEGPQDTDGDLDVDVLTGTAWIYRLNGAGEKVPCRAQGSFARGTPGTPTFGDPTWKAEWTLGEDCVVVGNQAGTPGTGTAPRGTFHSQHGRHGPCFAGTGGCTDNFKVDFDQFFPKPGPFLTLNGPNSAGTNCDRPVTVTARLTVSGWPEPNVPVTFTVVGPAPAAPPAGAGVTAADGRASFAFTAAQPGDYVVAAEVTYQGEQRRATHTIAFAERPPLSIRMTGPPAGHTDDAVTVTVIVTNPCTAGLPVLVGEQPGFTPGANVHFSVAGADPPSPPWLVPGRPTPTSGDATTGPFGTASFTFTGDRAGDYVVTATTSLPTGFQASATHTVGLDINTMKRMAAIDATDQGSSNRSITAAVRDPGGRFAYFGAQGLLVKVDLTTFQRVGAITVVGANGNPVSRIMSAVMDPDARFAYLGASDFDAGNTPGVIKVDLNSPDPSGFKQVGLISLDPVESGLESAVIDPAGDFAYFGATGSNSEVLGRVVKIDLRTFQRVGAITLEQGGSAIGDPWTAVLDPAGRFAYFGTMGLDDDTVFGSVVKVDLATFEVAGAIRLQPEEYSPHSAVVDPAGRYAYFGTRRSGSSSRVVRVDLTTFQRVDAIALPLEESGDDPVSKYPAVIDPAGDFAYFGSDGKKVVKIDLRAFQRFQAISLSPDAAERNLASAVIEPAGEFAYFGTNHKIPNQTGSPAPPERVVKVRLKRPPNPTLAADNDGYATANATPLTVPAPGVLDGDRDTGDNDPLIATQASDPAGGSVTLNPDGGFTYTPDPGFAGTDTFTYTATDGMDYSSPATVSLTVAPPQGLTGSAYGYYSKVSLFGGPFGERGPAPTVALAPDGSNSPEDAHLNEAEAVYGPATLFKSGPIDVHAEGAMAPSPQAKTSATVQGHPDAAQRPGPLLYDGLAANCSANSSGRVGSVKVTNGVVETKYDPNTQEPVEFHPVPPNPPPGYTVEGTIDHVGDRFRIVFNEQVQNPDGSTTVAAAHIYLLGPIAVGDLFMAQSVCGVPASLPSVKAIVDFDGDGDSDISVYRPSQGVWYVQGGATTAFGTTGDVAVPADYDGDGDVDVAVFRPANGVWFVSGGATVAWGTNGDVPVPADYDGDGRADLAVFRPSQGVWYVNTSGPGPDILVAWGTSGDVPVPADYDGDGDADIAVFRPSQGVWFVQGGTTVAFGTTGDIPVPADYDGDGDADMAVFRPSQGVWFVSGGATTAWGSNGDRPVPADYDGDGDAEIAVFRPSLGVWFVQGGTAVAFGTSGDRPLPLPAAIYDSMGAGS